MRDYKKPRYRYNWKEEKWEYYDPFTITLESLRAGLTKNWNCLNKEKVRELMTTQGRVQHGKKGNRRLENEIK